MSRLYTQEIKQCYLCPAHEHRDYECGGWEEDWCTKYNKRLPNSSEFPKWCKLKEVYEIIKETSAGICRHCGKPMLKHIIKEGARDHVDSWNAFDGINCSEPDCENNHGVGKCVPK